MSHKYSIIFVLGLTLFLSSVSCTISDNGLSPKERSGETQKASFRHVGTTAYRNQVRQQRPGIAAPPYAVPMEPVFKYSQRDPLYEQNSKNHTKLETVSISAKVDHEIAQTKHVSKRVPFGGPNRGRRPNPHHHHHHPPPQHHHHYPYYPEPPEPIIEIIIKESNISLPAPTTTPPPPTTKEPIHVFYVKYKKNPHPSEHGDEIIYEEPVPALTPHATEIVEGEPNYGPTYAEPVPTHSPPPSTTLRTIIKPDSEVYHGSGIKVTFGSPDNDRIEEEYGQSAPQPQVALPEAKKSLEDEETSKSTKHHYTKRQQGPYPQKQLRQDVPTFEQPSNQFQYESQNIPSNHRFPGQPTQKYFHRDNSRIPNPHPSQTSALFQSGHQNSAQQNVGPVLVSPSQQLQAEHSFLQPTQQVHTNHYINQHTNEPQRLQSQATVTEEQIQEYQKHKEFLIQQNLNQQTVRNKPISQVPSTAQPLHNLSHGFRNNAHPLQQQSRTQLPHIHVEQAPIIDQTIPLPHRLSSQRESYYQQPAPKPQPYIFENKGFVDSNYGQRLIEKQQYTDKRLEQIKPTKQPLFSSQYQGDAKLKNNYEQTENQQRDDKVPNAEIIKSISSLEEHQIQPALNINGHIQPTDATLKQKYNNHQTQAHNRVRNQQPNYQTNSNTRYNFRNDDNIRKQYHFNGQQSHLRNSEYSVQPTELSRATANEERTNDKSKYLTVYTRPQHTQNRRFPAGQSSTSRYNNRLIQTTAAPTTEVARTEFTTTNKPDMTESQEEEERKKANIAALPEEVPDDLREQLLSSGILGNADISILDYDKVGDIPIESLPPEALENFYGAASDPVPSIVMPDTPEKTVEMRVVRYDPNSEDAISNTYFQENATKIDPVFLNDSKYKRYLPLKVSGAQFPIPDLPQLKNRHINSVVVLAPVDYDFIKTQDDAEQNRRGRIIQIQGVKFVVGDSLMTVIKNPTKENYNKWLMNELAVPTDKQSVILLVTRVTENNVEKEEIYMYETEKGTVRKLRGELSSAFVELATSNSQSEDLDRLGDE